MSELQVLATVRGHLLSREAAAHVHLALPPKAVYPLVLVELEEVWPNLCASGKGIQARLKFKASIYSQMSHWGEATLISSKVRHALEGVTLWMPESQCATLRFLTCVAEAASGQGQPLAMRHFYDAIISGEVK